MSRLTTVVAVIGLGALGAGGWALFWTTWNPDVAVPAPRIVSRPATGPTIEVVAAGDFAPSDAALRYIRKHGYRYPYEATASLFQHADVAFANLEAAITRSKRPFLLPKTYLYRVEPQATETFRWLGLDVVSVANNHIADYRDRGVVDTVRHLHAASIEPLGAGSDEAEARRGVVVDVGGTKLGWLGYLEDTAEYNLYYRTFAVGGHIGCARLEPDDVREDVRRMRAHADLVFVSVHWGDNYRPVHAGQRRDARLFADAGVDVVIGHHSHDVQHVQRIGKTLVLYSVGNYAWGAIGKPTLRVGNIARLTIARRDGDAPARLTAAELLPIVTQNRIVRYQPRRIRQSEMGWLEPMVAASRADGMPLEVVGTRIRIPLEGTVVQSARHGSR